MQRYNHVELIFWCLRGITLSCNCSLAHIRQLSRHRWAAQTGAQWDLTAAREMLLICMSQVREHFPGVPGELLTNLFLTYGSWGTSADSILIDGFPPPPPPILVLHWNSVHVLNPTKDLPGVAKILRLTKEPSTNTHSVALQTPLGNCHSLAFYITPKFVCFYRVAGGQWPTSEWKFKHRKHPVGQYSDCIR